MYLVLALLAGGTGADQYKYVWAFSSLLFLMPHPFAPELLFRNCHEFSYIYVEFHCLEAKKQSANHWYFCYLHVPCNWQQLQFIALWIPPWSHMYSRDRKGHVRSNVGKSANCIHIKEKLKLLATYSKRERTNFPNCLCANLMIVDLYFSITRTSFPRSLCIQSTQTTASLA